MRVLMIATLLLLCGCELVEMPERAPRDGRSWLGAAYGNFASAFLREAIGTEDYGDNDLYDQVIDAIENDLAFRQLNNLGASKGLVVLTQEESAPLFGKLSDSGYNVLVAAFNAFNKFWDPTLAEE